MQVNIEAWQVVVAVAPWALSSLARVAIDFLRFRAGHELMTIERCEDHREQCRAELLGQLRQGDGNFRVLQARDDTQSRILIAVGLAVSNICQHTGADCGDLPKLLRELGGSGHEQARGR